MRHQSKEFLQRFIEKNGSLGDVLEVGSLDVNGNIKDIVTRSSTSYTGSDMREGSNVDVIVNGHELVKHFGKDRFDTVICFDTFEHDDKFWETVFQMREVLTSGGYMIISAPGRACPLHDHPDDYWRFMPSAFKEFLRDMEDVNIETEYHEIEHAGNQLEDEIYGSGQKK